MRNSTLAARTLDLDLLLYDDLVVDAGGLMLPRDDSAMRLVVNRTLAGLFRSGEIKDIYNKWFMSDIPGSQALMVPMGDTLETNFAVQAFLK